MSLLHPIPRPGHFQHLLDEHIERVNREGEIMLLFEIIQQVVQVLSDAFLHIEIGRPVGHLFDFDSLLDADGQFRECAL